MDYNTTRRPLIFREYGRNIQSLVEYALTVDDLEKRQAIAEYIIGLMGQMNPHLRNVEQFRHKLWDHLYRISSFRLEVDSPYPMKEPEEGSGKPDRMPYPQSRIRYRHYGKNVERLVAKAMTMDSEPEKQKEFAHVIGNYMKMAYRNWNDENVDNSTIFRDLKILSENILVLDEESNLDRLSRSNRNKNKNQNSSSKSSGGSNNNRYRSNNNGRSSGGRSSNNRYSNNNKRDNNYRNKRRK